MHRTQEEWSKMQPRAVLAGSDTWQRLNVLTMAQEDICELGRALEAIKTALLQGDTDGCFQLVRKALGESDPTQPVRTR